MTTYKGYTITNAVMTDEHKNPVSGHSWTTTRVLNSLCIIGPFARSGSRFNTVKSAMREIDFLVSSLPYMVAMHSEDRRAVLNGEHQCTCSVCKQARSIMEEHGRRTEVRVA